MFTEIIQRFFMGGEMSHGFETQVPDICLACGDEFPEERGDLSDELGGEWVFGGRGDGDVEGG